MNPTGPAPLFAAHPKIPKAKTDARRMIPELPVWHLIRKTCETHGLNQIGHGLPSEINFEIYRMKYHAKLHIWTSGLAALANLLSCSTVHVCRRLPYLGLKKWVLLEHSAVSATVTKAGLKLSEQSSPRSGHLTQGDIGSDRGANLIKSGYAQRSAICSARLSLLKYWQYWSCIREPSLKLKATLLTTSTDTERCCFIWMKTYENTLHRLHQTISSWSIYIWPVVITWLKFHDLRPAAWKLLRSKQRRPVYRYKEKLAITKVWGQGK